jgi:hypothetical protein
MKATITIEVPENMDLEHFLESISDALYYADNVTSKEQDLVIQLIQKIKKQVDNETNTN